MRRITTSPTYSTSSITTSPLSTSQKSSSNASDNVGQLERQQSEPRRPVSIIKTKPPIGGPPPPLSPRSPLTLTSPVTVQHQSSNESKVSQIIQNPVSPTNDFRQESYNIAINTDKPQSSPDYKDRSTISQSSIVSDSNRYNTLPSLLFILVLECFFKMF